MAEIWKPQPKEVIQQWITDILTEASDDLSDWEIGFVSSCQMGLDRYGQLTEKMQDTLERIYAGKTK